MIYLFIIPFMTEDNSFVAGLKRIEKSELASRQVYSV